MKYKITGFYHVEKYPLPAVGKMPSAFVLNAAPNTHMSMMTSARARSTKPGRVSQNLVRSKAIAQSAVETTPHARPHAYLPTLDYRPNTFLLTSCSSKSGLGDCNYRCMWRTPRWRRRDKSPERQSESQSPACPRGVCLAYNHVDIVKVAI